MNEDIYMVQPLGFEQHDPSLVCKLYKVFYEVKQAPRAWYEKLTQALVQFSFSHNKCDHSLFIYSHQVVTLYALVYMDDILITSFSFLLRFIEGFSRLALLLTQLTRKGQTFVWNALCEESFQEIKKKLTSASVLILPSPTESFVVYCDASLMRLGGVLMQNRKVVAYTSRQLKMHICHMT